MTWQKPPHLKNQGPEVEEILCYVMTSVGGPIGSLSLVVLSLSPKRPFEATGRGSWGTS